MINLKQIMTYLGLQGGRKSDIDVRSLQKFSFKEIGHANPLFSMLLTTIQHYLTNACVGYINIKSSCLTSKGIRLLQ